MIKLLIKTNQQRYIEYLEKYCARFLKPGINTVVLKITSTLSYLKSAEEQTRGSKITRVVSIALGALAAFIGVLILLKMAGFPPAVGWAAIGIGTSLAGGGISLKGVKPSDKDSLHNQNTEEVDPNQSANPTSESTSSVEGNESSTEVSKEIQYSLDKVIEKIKEEKLKGMQIGLFVGRENDQEMPKEENWAWFSLNEGISQKAPTDHHLVINFNESEIMLKIKGLFDKVVVDRSVIKFFDLEKSPWDNLHPLLVQKATSQLIVECYRGIESFGSFLDIDAKNCRLQHPIAAASNEEEKKKNRNNFLAAIQIYLSSNLFKEVVQKTTLYPYRSDENPTEYWVATDPT